MATAPAAKTTEKAAAPKLPKELYVLDTTATAQSGPRDHEQIVDGSVQSFKFEPGKPLKLPYEIAAKFLKTEAFKLCDDKGNRIAYTRRPKQPDELQAGEKLTLGEEETIARYNELSSKALFQRCVELPGGEKFAKSETRPADKDMIAFIKEHRAKLAKANLSREKDIGDGEFTPEGSADDDFDDGDED